MTIKSLFFIIIVTFVSCNKSQQTSLDIKSYFAESNKDEIYPNVKQKEILKAVIPNKSFQPSPSIYDRNYWGKIAASKSGKDYISIVMPELEIQPEVPISDSIYRYANKKGNRGVYKPRYYRTMVRLEQFVLAECIENKGRFLPQIENYLEAIMSMKSWLHPNHDDKNNGVLEGRRVSIDLGARRFGSDLALAEVLLGDKLQQEVRAKIKVQLQTRIIDSYLTSCENLDENNRWIKSTSNWNSVCTSGTLFVIIAMSQNKEERIAAIGSALNSMKYYLSGFGKDGYCSEGAGYWGYGFGHYLYLAQMLFDYSEGAINLFEADDREKLINVGNFPERYQIHKGICAPISDGVSKVSNDGGFAYTMSAKYFNAKMPPRSTKPKTHDSFSALYQLMEWNFEESMKEIIGKNNTFYTLPDYTYFDDVGMVISRGKQEIPLSIAFKAGHNAENHNHSDVGTYTIVLNKDIVSGDIGAPSYRAGSFAKDNPARSSWGHPVPRINNTLQSNGIDYSGKIISSEFTELKDKVVADIKSAYDIPELKSLIRTVENDKNGNGIITVIDEFSTTKPVLFGTAIMTLSDYKIINDNTVVISSNNQKIKVEVSSVHGKLLILDELVPVKHLREGAPAYRIGIDFELPKKRGIIKIKYSPILEKTTN